MRISAKWRRKAVIYEYLARQVCPSLDFSEWAAMQAFLHESCGTKVEDPNRNGFVVGKMWVNVQEDAWREGIREGLFSRQELLEDQDIPTGWAETAL